MSYAYVVIEQPAGTFYVTAMPASEVVRISKAKPRIFNPETLTSEGGIQREPSERRIKAISDYVATTDAAFPTAVLLAVKSEDCVLQDGQISIAGEGVADIVDGQHRVEGLRCSPKTDVAKFTLPIVLIIDSTRRKRHYSSRLSTGLKRRCQRRWFTTYMELQSFAVLPRLVTKLLGV